MLDIFIESINFLNEYFRPILILLTSGFAIYFAIQKFGCKFIASYTVNGGRDLPSHIKAVSIENNKDRTFAI